MSCQRLPTAVVVAAALLLGSLPGLAIAEPCDPLEFEVCYESPNGDWAPVIFTEVQGGIRGRPAEVTVHTAPNVPCWTQFWLPSGTPSGAEGQGPEAMVITDQDGDATWRWVVGEPTRLGTGKVTTNCETGIVETDLEIREPDPADARGGTPAGESESVIFAEVRGGVRGQRTEVTVQTAPDVQCWTQFWLPSGAPSGARGQGPDVVVVTDEDGKATWRWVIGTPTRLGTARVTTTCETGRVEADLVLREPPPAEEAWDPPAR